MCFLCGNILFFKAVQPFRRAFDGLAAVEELARFNRRTGTGRMQVFGCAAEAAAAGRSEEYDRLAGKIVAFQKGLDD